MVIGLDCADPALVFDRWRDELPNLGRLIDSGLHGPLRSTDPPITVPAWTSMMTGKDPGQLGFYGFRNRSDYSYDGMAFANSALVKEPAVWDILTAAGRRSILIGIPQTYPPKAINGLMVCDFLTPSKKARWTYPDDFKDRVEEISGGYMIDVDDFRTDDKERLVEQVYEMTERRFRLARHLAAHEPWDFFMMVEMGPDRLHHGFWRFFDPTHRLYEPGHRFENVIRDYYLFLDERLGELLETVDDDTVVMVVSDHGVKAMVGGICVNDWLIEQGLLALKEQPSGPTALKPEMIDWSRTTAWGEGGYYSRIFMNVSGREPLGIVPAPEYEAVRARLREAFESITDDRGANIGTKALYAEDIYRATRNVPPDLLVYFGDLNWRSIGKVGNGTVHVFDNDTGPDDANHDYHGIFVMSRGRGRREDLSIYDVAPTILRLLDMDIPADMIGRSLV
jgi:predicted AlkP superfamily phosphohydrolase/phosphomutase